MSNNVSLIKSPSYPFYCQYRKLLLALFLSLYFLPAYAAQTALQNQQIIVTGSAALSDLISLWADGYASQHPDTLITIADTGSVAGIGALLNDSANVILSSSPLNPHQLQQFNRRFNYSPTSVAVAMDGVTIYVNAQNPLQQISLVQLDAIYSSTLRCGARTFIRKWNQLGETGWLANAAIKALGLTNNTGAYHLFRHIALCDGDYMSDFQALTGASSLEAAIINNPDAIGFSSSAAHAAGLKVLAISRQKNKAAFYPSVQSIQTGRYPLSRKLFVIINNPPGNKISPTIKSFLDYALSPTGQAIALKAGYVPLPQH